jgi:hypothetical protein
LTLLCLSLNIWQSHHVKNKRGRGSGFGAPTPRRRSEPRGTQKRRDIISQTSGHGIGCRCNQRGVEIAIPIIKFYSKHQQMTSKYEPRLTMWIAEKPADPIPHLPTLGAFLSNVVIATTSEAQTYHCASVTFSIRLLDIPVKSLAANVDDWSASKDRGVRVGADDVQAKAHRHDGLRNVHIF